MTAAAARFLLLPLLCLAACGIKDKTVSCVKDKAQIPAMLGFSGYTAAELDTVIVVSYADETDLTKPFKYDTLRNANLQIVGGVPRQGGLPFPSRIWTQGAAM